MTSKLLAVIVRNRLDPSGHGLETFNNGSADLLGSLAIDLGRHCKTAFSLNQSDDGMLVSRPNDGVAFPVANAAASLDDFRPLGNRAPVRDLATTFLSAGIAFTSLFLASQGAP